MAHESGCRCDVCAEKNPLVLRHILLPSHFGTTSMAERFDRLFPHFSMPKFIIYFLINGTRSFTEAASVLVLLNKLFCDLHALSIADQEFRPLPEWASTLKLCVDVSSVPLLVVFFALSRHGSTWSSLNGQDHEKKVPGLAELRALSLGRKIGLGSLLTIETSFFVLSAVRGYISAALFYELDINGPSEGVIPFSAVFGLFMLLCSLSFSGKKFLANAYRYVCEPNWKRLYSPLGWLNMLVIGGFMRFYMKHLLLDFNQDPNEGRYIAVQLITTIVTMLSVFFTSSAAAESSVQDNAANDNLENDQDEKEGWWASFKDKCHASCFFAFLALHETLVWWLLNAETAYDAVVDIAYHQSGNQTAIAEQPECYSSYLAVQGHQSMLPIFFVGSMALTAVATVYYMIYQLDSAHHGYEAFVHFFGCCSRQEAAYSPLPNSTNGRAESGLGTGYSTFANGNFRQSITDQASRHEEVVHEHERASTRRRELGSMLYQ